MEKKLSSPLDLLKGSWQIFANVWLNYLILYLILIFGAMAIVFVALGSTFGTMLLTPGNVPNTDILTKSWPILLIGLVALVFFSSAFGLAISKVIYSAGEKTEISLKEALTYGFHNFLPYFGVSLLTGLVIVIGFILLVIPGVYLAVTLSLVPVIFVLEEKHNLSVLSRSRELVKDYFWPVFGRFMVLVLISIVISAITSNENAEFLSFILNSIFTPVSIAYTYLLYKSLIEVKGKA